MTKHAIDPLEVPSESITRTRAKKLNEALNEFVQHVWAKMDLKDQVVSMKLKEQP
jgi:hypothetical protein